MPDSEPQPGRERRRLALACLALGGVSLGLYARAVFFDFVSFDDPSVLLAHPNLYDESSLLASLREIFLDYFPREEPLLLRDVTWALDARLFGFENPLGYHLGNVVLNALNAPLLLLFLQHATRRFDFALVVSGLFVLLPVHVEPVCWVMGRKELLVSFWMLLGLLAQSHELRARDPRRRRSLYALTLLCTGLALLSKMSAVVFFLVLGLHRVLHPYLDGRRAPAEPLAWGPALRTTLPRLAPHAALSIGVFLWFQGVIEAYGVVGWRGPGPLDPGHLATVAGFAPLVIGQHLEHLFWPAAQLSSFYRWPHVEIPLTRGQALASAAIAAALLASVAWTCLRRRDLAFYLLSFLALLIPYLSIVYVSIWVADRYVYLASFTLLAVVVTLGFELHARLGPARVGVVALGLVFAASAAAKTWVQQPVWRDSEALWSYEAYRDEPSLQSLQALARLHVKRAEAEPDPELRRPHLERAVVEIERGIARERALGRRPSPYRTPEQLHLSRLHALRGRVLGLLGAPLERQLEHFTRAHALAPDRANAMRLTRSYFELGVRSEGPEGEALLRRSLGYFVEYVEFSRSDPRKLAESRTILASNYDEERFPFLADEIREVRRTYFP